MCPNPQFYADLVTFNEEIFNGKLHFFCRSIRSIFRQLYLDSRYFFPAMVGNHRIQYPRIASSYHLSIKRQTKQTDGKNGVIKALTKRADRCNQREYYY